MGRSLKAKFDTRTYFEQEKCSIFVPRKSNFDLIIEYETSKSFIDGKLEWLSNIFYLQ